VAIKISVFSEVKPHNLVVRYQSFEINAASIFMIVTVQLLFTYSNHAGSRLLCNAGTHVPDLTASCSINHRRDSNKQCRKVAILVHIKNCVQEISLVHLHFVIFRFSENAEALERQA
jgi:hypothetical protein